MLAVSFVSLGIALITLGLRLYARIKIVRKLGWDDACIVAATVSDSKAIGRSLQIPQCRKADSLEVLSCVGVGMNVPEVLEGVGRHVYYIGPVDAAQAIKWSTMAQAQNVLSTGLVKISICIFLLRILTSKAMARFLYAVIGLLVAITAVCFSAVVVQCRPLQKLWNPQVHGKCWGPLVTPKIGRAQGSKSDGTTPQQDEFS